MLRRDVRLRKEYLYRKSLEEKESKKYEKKQLLKEALDMGKPIPAEIRKESGHLAEQLTFDEGLDSTDSILLESTTFVRIMHFC